jgi:hypothetical protein
MGSAICKEWRGLEYLDLCVEPNIWMMGVGVGLSLINGVISSQKGEMFGTGLICRISESQGGVHLLMVVFYL